MSPEQVRGGEVGPQTHLWAFGCLLYECLTGRPAFPGQTGTERMSRALESEPSWPQPDDPVSAAIVRLVKKCLIKDPVQRISRVSEVRDEIVRISREAVMDPPAPATLPSRLIGITVHQRLSRLLAATVFALLLVALIRSEDGGPAEIGPLRRLTTSGSVSSFDLSPDDRTAAYATTWGALVLLELETAKEIELFRSPGLSKVNWSPDGRTILVGSRVGARHASYLVDVESRASVRVEALNFNALDWTHDGKGIVGVIPVPNNGAGVERLALLEVPSWRMTSYPLDPGINLVSGVQCSPTGSELLVYGTASDGGVACWIAGRIGGPTMRLPIRGYYARWAAGGDAVLYLTLGETPVLRRLQTNGLRSTFDDDSEVAELTSYAPSFVPFHSGSQILLSTWSSTSTLWSFERRGEDWTRRALYVESGPLFHPRLSPDGRSVAVADCNEPDVGIVVLPLDTATSPMRIDQPCLWIAWSPDGRSIAYRSTESELLTAVDLSSGATRVLSNDRCHGYVYWYPSEHLRYQPVSTTVRGYRWIESATDAERPFPDGRRGTVFQSAVSPDGRWMALAGNRNGIEEVVVWLVDLVEGTETILHDGAAAPIGWSADGTWVYAARSEPFGEHGIVEEAEVIRIPVGGGEAETVVQLPAGDLVQWSDADISPDGSRVVATIMQRSNDLWVSEID